MALKKFSLAALCLFAQLGLVSGANAATVTFSFVADRGRTVGSPQPGTLAGLANPFTTIHGTFSYDTATSDTNSDPAFGNFDNALISVDEFVLPTANQSGVDTLNDFFARDAMTVYYRASDLSFRSFINFVDLTASAFDSDALPGDLNLGDFADTAEIGFFSSADSATAYFNLTSLQRVESPSPVPLPSGIILFLSALGGLAAARRRSSRRTGENKVPAAS